MSFFLFLTCDWDVDRVKNKKKLKFPTLSDASMVSVSNYNSNSTGFYDVMILNLYYSMFIIN